MKSVSVQVQVSHNMCSVALVQMVTTDDHGGQTWAALLSVGFGQ